MKNLTRLTSLITGACGLILAAGLASSPHAYADDGVINSDTTIDVNSGFICSQQAAACINGAVDSGNVHDAQNVYVSGPATSSGSPTNNNANTQTGAKSSGTTSKSGSNTQKISR